VQTMGATLKPFLNDVGNVQGQSPPVAAVSRCLVSGKAVV
jgi:hypothetical protein